MGFFEDVGNFVSSGLSAAGDLVEGVVDTLVETAESGVDAAEDVIDNVAGGVRDWIGGNTNPILTGMVNIALGLATGLMDFTVDIARTTLHVAGDVGHVVADLFRLDFAKVIADLGNLGIGLLELVVAGLRLVTGGYFAGAIAANFERDRAFTFVRQLVISEFGEKTAAGILKRLGFGTTRVGLRVPIDYSVLRMDSAVYPLAADHNAGVFDLFGLGGLLSFGSFQVDRVRTRVVMVDGAGADQWYLPVGRSVIQSFLDTGSPRLRVYAWKNHAASRAMRFARQKLHKLLILADFGSIESLSRFQAASVIDITNSAEFRMHGDDRLYELGRFVATSTSQNGQLIDDTRVAAIGAFGFSTLTLNGIAAGLDIVRSDRPGAACGASDASDGCITSIQRSEGDYDLTVDDPRGRATGDPTTPCGRGVLHRDAYPAYFSKVVLAHELGHHFGLAHAGHAGVQNIMYSRNQEALTLGLLKYWQQGEPDFQSEDVEHAWRFIVKRMPHVIGGG